MTKTKSDAVASWYFNMKLARLWNSEELNHNIFPYNHLNVLAKLLEIFEREQLFITSKLEFIRGKFGDSEIDVKGLEVNDILRRILDEIQENERSGCLLFHGSTNLLVKGTKQLVDRIFEIGFELGSGRIQLDSYADCWVPIDRNDELQVEMALDASQRLERCLNQVNQLAEYTDIEPENDEDVTSQILPQRGFRVYTYEGMYAFDELSQEQQELVKPFIWENRFDN